MNTFTAQVYCNLGLGAAGLINYHFYQNNNITEIALN